MGMVFHDFLAHDNTFGGGEQKLCEECTFSGLGEISWGLWSGSCSYASLLGCFMGTPGTDQKKILRLASVVFDI